MNGVRSCAAAMLAVVLGLAHAAGAFHEGGAGYCEGCHGLRGVGIPSTGGTGTFLLTGSDASSTCLGCHADRGVAHNVLSDDGSSRTPGGDFYWLRKTFSWRGRDRGTSPGERHGHNVTAADFGLVADSKIQFAPGGSYAAADLSCISCHDPHARTAGRALSRRAALVVPDVSWPAPTGPSTGSYRLLRGTAGGFKHEAPVARAPAADWVETDQNHVAYGSGMSEWCANCHVELLNSTPSGGGKHAAGDGAKLGATVAADYNRYVKSGNLTGSSITAYLALVPFETGASDVALLDPSSRSGPAPGANVMCVTCHRAHASAFPSMGRWDFTATFLADSHPKQGDGGATSADVVNSYYGRDMAAEFGPYQRSLCNKCHPRD